MRKYKDRMFINKEWLFDELDEENLRQISKWGIQERTAFEWLAFTMEELGELAEAINENHYREGPKEKVISEAFHVATLALKIAEMFKASEE
ncbi:MAG TPA: hypothetical protein ENH82_12005 [bacterium]|nr:hypothetical protein [bacterium]